MRDEKLDNIDKELKQKQVDMVKEIVRLTFEQLESLESIKEKVQNQIKVLKHDLVDLKEGRLDRILERQNIDKNVTRSTSVMRISSVHTETDSNKQINPWYVDYDVQCLTIAGIEISCKINNSIARINASGTYKLQNGAIKYL